MKAKKNTKICDACKERVATNKCFVCEKDLCHGCGFYPEKSTIDTETHIYIKFKNGLMLTKDETKIKRFCKECTEKISTNKIGNESIAIFLKNELLTEKI